MACPACQHSTGQATYAQMAECRIVDTFSNNNLFSLTELIRINS